MKVHSFRVLVALVEVFGGAAGPPAPSPSSSDSPSLSGMSSSQLSNLHCRHGSASLAICACSWKHLHSSLASLSIMDTYLLILRSMDASIPRASAMI